MHAAPRAAMAVEGKETELPGPVEGDEAIPPAGGLNDHVERVLFSERLIKERVAEMGAALSAELDGQKPLLVGVLTGAFVFVADLARSMTCETQVRRAAPREPLTRPLTVSCRRSISSPCPATGAPRSRPAA